MMLDILFVAFRNILQPAVEAELAEEAQRTLETYGIILASGAALSDVVKLLVALPQTHHHMRITIVGATYVR